MNIKAFTVCDVVLWILFLFALDLFDLAGLLLFFDIILFYSFYLQKIKFDYISLLLIGFSLSYFFSVLFYEGTSYNTIMKYAIYPWACYVLGYNLIRIKKNLSVTGFSKIIFLGFFLHGFFNLLASIIQYGIDFNNPFRLAWDFWQNRQISVTTASLYYTPMVLWAVGSLFGNQKKESKVVSVLIISVGLFATVLYQNRTLILAGLVIVVTALVFVTFDKNISKKTKNKLFACAGLAIVLLIVVWVTNIGGIQSLLENTSFFARLKDAKGQSRTMIWKSFIFGDAWKYPFGGSKVSLYGNQQFVHNTWLDIYRRTGFIPFLTFCVFTLASIKTIVRFKSCCNCEKNRLEDYQTLSLALIGVACVFFVEPVMEANSYIFYLPVFVVGAINGRTSDKRK